MSVTRRDFLKAGGAGAVALPLATALFAAAPVRPRLAVVTTIYHLNSHADHIVGRFLKGYTLRGRHHQPEHEVVSMYVEQSGERDLSAGLARKFGFRLCRDIPQALTLGSGRLAVDGVLLIAEHGDYPENELGQKLYPRHEMLSQIVEVFRSSGRSVPVFNDKHLSYSWEKARQMVDWSRELGFPLQAGSSLPVTFRLPELEFPLGTRFEQALAVAFSHPDIYGFHLLETLQCHVERRAGGETGVRAVQALSGEAVWAAGLAGAWSHELLEEALSRSHTVNIGRLRDNVREPIAFLLEYRDGFKAQALLLNGHVEDFTFAARVAGKKGAASTMHYLPGRPAVKFFDGLVWNIERMFAAGRAVIPVERTLLVSGALEALLKSRHQKGARLETPHLDVAYQAPEDSGCLRGPADAAGQRERA
jgi:hypothetical protein